MEAWDTDMSGKTKFKVGVEPQTFTGTPIELTEPYVGDDEYARGGTGAGRTLFIPNDEPRLLTNEEIAIQFHYTYEALAPSFGWNPQKESSVAWEDLPETNKQLMIATVAALLARGVIKK